MIEGKNETFKGVKRLHEGIGLLNTEELKLVLGFQHAESGKTESRSFVRQNAAAAGLVTVLPSSTLTTLKVESATEINEAEEIQEVKEVKVSYSKGQTLSVVRVIAAVIVNLFFWVSVFSTFWFSKFLFPKIAIQTSDKFWLLLSKLNFEFPFFYKVLPEVFWPFVFWTFAFVLIVQSLTVMTFGKTLGHAVAGVSMSTGGVFSRIHLLVAETVTLFGILSLPWVLMFPRRVPLVFWIRLRKSLNA